MTRQLTGRHIAAVFTVFFGVVIGVNFVMARYAIGTFGGTVVGNSYVASQNFNRWLADAERQERLGWTPNVSLDPSRRIRLSVTKFGTRLENVSAGGFAVHPLGRASAIPLTFRSIPGGTLLADQRLPRGRWHVRLSLRHSTDTLKLDQPVQ
jgi:nitrogen fixation protein FixH